MVNAAAPVTGTQVLGAAAGEAIDLVGGELSSRVRECGGDTCYLLFLDTSRPGNRRWCSMERCGNRHKVRGYRSRQTGRRAPSPITVLFAVANPGHVSEICNTGKRRLANPVP